MFYGMLNDRLLYKKAIRTLGKGKSDLASKFTNYYQVEALKLVNKDNYSKALLFDTEDKVRVLKILGDEDIEKTIYLIGAYRNKPQKIFKIASEFEMLDYDSSQYIEAFYKLERCVKNNECKSKCINEIDNNLNFIDCFKDLEVDHQDL